MDRTTVTLILNEIEGVILPEYRRDREALPLNQYVEFKTRAQINSAERIARQIRIMALEGVTA